MRRYEFLRVSPGEGSLAFRVAANQALFTAHRVPLQEGPDLCRRLLISELQKRERSQRPLLRCFLTESDMLEHLARHPVRALRRQPHYRHPALPAKA